MAEYNRHVNARALRLINVSIAVCAVALVIVAYWFLLRPLPQTEGTVAAPVSAPAVIARDAIGVPHIQAATWQDAIFLQGFATAQDRLWQMDTLRRYSGGELAEVVGPAALRLDEIARRLRLRAIAEAQVRSLRGDDRVAFVQFARGVNFFIQTSRGRYPLEFSLPGHAYDPQPWSPVETALIGLVMSRNLSESYASDISRGQLMQGGAGERRRVLFPAREGEPELPGSNAWAVSGSHTASGHAMLANDPHLGVSIPSIWHMVHLKAPGLNVIGVTIPGVPGVIIGHNQQIAWGVTNLEFDCQDVYAEQLDARTGRYLYEGKLEQAQLDRQTIGVRGREPVQINTWITRHGPVVEVANGRSYAVRWTAADGFGFPFLDIDRANGWGAFRAAASRYWGPPQNFVYADRAGHIGYQAAGRIPIRKSFSGDAPLDGSLSQNDWTGYVAFDQMPTHYDPPGGMIATANQDPFPKDFPYPVAGSFADSYRVHQIRCLLMNRQRLTTRDMLSIQTDVFSAYHLFLAHQVLAAAELAHSQPEGVSLLRGWNGQMARTQAAPFLTELLHRQLGLSLVKLAAPGVSSQLAPRPQVIERLLRTRPPGWVPGNDWDGWLLANLREAFEAGRRQLGSRAAQWQWGKVLAWTIDHPVGKELPLLARYFDIGPAPMSGAGTTVKQTKPNMGPSMRMVVDWGNLDASVQNLVTGESGHVASSHYRDQWHAYDTGVSFPMQFERVDARQSLHVVPSSVR